MSGDHHRQIQDIGWSECLLALFLILCPTALCSLVPKRCILKYQRELLTCSLGTIFAIVFMDLVPELIDDAITSKHNPTLLSLSIFGGIAFAFIMNTFHDALERTKCNNDDDSCNERNNKDTLVQSLGENLTKSNSSHHQMTIAIGQTEQKDAESIGIETGSNSNQSTSTPMDTELNDKTAHQKRLSAPRLLRLPCQVKIFLAATTIDFIIDGFIIACEGIVISIALLPHEFVHVLGDLVFLVNFGLGKRQAVLLRLVCQLATPISGCLVKMLRDIYRETLDTMHTYGHGFIAGIFLYVLMIDIFPMIQEGHLESHQHHPHLEPSKRHSRPDSHQRQVEDEETDCSEKAKFISSRILLPVLFGICFGITGSLIYGKEHIESLLKRWI